MLSRRYTLASAMFLLIAVLSVLRASASEWRETGFTACSTTCGKGIQTSQVTCMDADGPAEESECHHSPRPTTKMRSCKNSPCPPYWNIGAWSSCSASCGSGHQKRLVQCERPEKSGHTRKCPRPRPDETRSCNLHPCPVQYSTFVQLRPKRRLSLEMFGEAILIAGTNISLYCTAYNASNPSITWLKNNHGLRNLRRFNPAVPGILTIKRIRIKDRGHYACKTNGVTSNITLKLHSQQEAQQQLHDLKRLEYFDGKKKLFNKSLARKKLPKLRTGLPDGYWQRDEASTSGREYTYAVSDWSPCSNYCAPIGYQTRNITCQLLRGDYLTIANESSCSGDVRPAERQDCGLDRCGVWQVSGWSQCSSVVCTRNWVGIRRRRAECQLDGLVVNSTLCDPSAQPVIERECRNPQCIAMWTTSNWTRCSRSCGDPGFQTRLLRCVWRRGRGAAGAQCSGLMRPLVFRECTPPSCSEAVCRDSSRHCSMAAQLNLCNLDTYKHACCRTCRRSRRRHG